MKTPLRFLFGLILFLPGFAQAQWTARQSLGSGHARVFSTSFSINGKVYLVGGQSNYTGLADVWEYDPLADSWSQKNPFPGGMRGGAVSFAIAGKGYFMCGSNYAGQYFQDVWEYDPATDTWLQKNNFPGNRREEATGFVIGGKGYLGTGYLEVVGPNSTFFVAFSDFWEYDPVTDTWTMKALFPGSQRGWAVGAAVNGKGYIGLGGNSSQNGSYSDLYEYDPLNDSWTTKASYGLAVSDAMVFTLGQQIYVCGGIDFSSMMGSAALKKFDPVTNSWTSLQSMPAGVTMGAAGVTCNNRAFVGTGYNPLLQEKNDWWEFVTTVTLCPAPVSFVTSTMATNGTAQCDGKIIVSGITNGCAPYTVSVTSGSGSVTGSGTSFTISGLCDATYTVSVKDNDCCGASQSVAVVPGNLLSSVGKTDPLHDLRIFPNPGSGTFILSGPVAVNDIQIRIKNTLGQDIGFRTQSLPEGMAVRLEEAAAGIYVVWITGKNGYTRVRQLQVN